MFNLKIKVNNEHKLQTKINNEHSFSIKAFGATIYQSISGGIRYTSKTIISKVVVLAKITGTTTYRARQSMKCKIFARLPINSLKYKSSTTTTEKFLVRLFPTSKDIYQSYTSLIKEKIVTRLKPKTNNFASVSEIKSEKMIGKMKGSLNCSYLSEIKMKGWIKLNGLLKFTNTTVLSVKSWLRASSNTPIKYAVTIKDVLSIKSMISNKSTYSTKVSKDRVNARAIGTATKYVCSAIETSVNHVIVKVTGKNKLSSSTSIDNTKTHQYYVHKLSDFDGKKLNELPHDLLRCCYVVDKDWGLVGKVYKTWADLKDRVASWSDLR